MLERYYSLGHIDNSSKLKLFRGIMHTKNGERLRALVALVILVCANCF